jgi:energy-coupling factor transporter transmembrane protein EcfT
MTSMTPLPLIVAIACTVAAVLLFIAGVAAIKKKRLFGAAVSMTLVLLLFALSGLFVLLALATQGYQALTREETIAVITLNPIEPQTFIARFAFADGRSDIFTIEGDELYVDAHILKWKPIANILGIHTAYELDRISGRYRTVSDERTKPRTIYSIAQDKPVDMFNLRRKYSIFKALLDAEYGSATFIMADRPEAMELRVSTTGLLIRKRTDIRQK